jgi:hypothetical protein
VSNRVYQVRYFIDHDWNKPRASESQEVHPGIRVSADDFGYADSVVICSIVNKTDKPDEVSSILIVADKDANGVADRKVRELVHDAIVHDLLCHCPVPNVPALTTEQKIETMAKLSCSADRLAQLFHKPFGMGDDTTSPLEWLQKVREESNFIHDWLLGKTLEKEDA